MRLLVCTIMFVAILIAAMGFNGSAMLSFLDIPSLILVVGMTLCGTFALHTPQTVIGAFNMALSDGQSDEDPNKEAVFQDAARFAAASGVLGSVIGVVKMLGALEDPSALGPAMAVALLTMFYGLLLSQFVFLPLGRRVGSGHRQPFQRTNAEGYASLGIIIFGLGVVGICCVVMMWSFL